MQTSVYASDTWLPDSYSQILPSDNTDMFLQVKSTPITGFPGDPQIVPFWDVVSRGKKVCESAEVQPVTPGPTDIGIIMYTSGSTGKFGLVQQD